MQPSSPRCGAAHSPHNRPPLSVDALTHQSPPHSAVAAGLLLPSSFPKQQGRPAGLTSPQRRGHGSEAAAAGHGGGWDAEGPQLGVGTLGTHPVHRPDAPSPPAVTLPCFPALIPLVFVRKQAQTQGTGGEQHLVSNNKGSGNADNNHKKLTVKVPPAQPGPCVYPKTER